MAPTLIPGSKFNDERGTLNFFNAFEMNEVLRFYEIAPNSTETIRAWQGHHKEKKWLYCHSGRFLIYLIPIDSFERTPKNLEPQRFILEADKPTVLMVPGGYANGFRALEINSKLQVFSNLDLKGSEQDDYRYPTDQWQVDWEI